MWNKKFIEKKKEIIAEIVKTRKESDALIKEILRYNPNFKKEDLIIN